MRCQKEFGLNGGVAEWSIAPVLKTGGPQGPVGSNPTPSAKSAKRILIDGCGMRTKFERRVAAQTAQSAAPQG